jgi:sugar lactone lactonase YvrE
MRLHISFILILVLLLTSCGGDGGDGLPTDPPDEKPVPEITAVEPDSGKFGTEVTISGNNFSSTTSENNVTFNDIEATLVSATETELVAEVPEGAETGPVEVTVESKTAEGPEFTYIPTVTVSTYAGTGESGSQNGDRFQAEFNFPQDLTIKDDGTLYIADEDNHLIREISPEGQVTTLAGDEGTPGFEDGTGTEARFDGPCGLVLDAQGNLVVADRFNNSIRKVTAAGAVTTFAGDTAAGFSDGTGTEAKFDKPCGVAMDENQNLFVAEIFNHNIRKITPAAVVETYAGTGEAGYKDGPPIIAQFRRPEGPAITTNGHLLIADGNNDVVRVIPPGGEVSTLAGDGTEGDRDGTVEEARFNSPSDIAVGEDGTIYISENSNNVIRRIKDGQVTTLAGTGEFGFVDGPGEDAQFHNPRGVVIDDEGNLFVVDSGNHRIRKIIIR